MNESQRAQSMVWISYQFRPAHPSGRLMDKIIKWNKKVIAVVVMSQLIVIFYILMNAL